MNEETKQTLMMTKKCTYETCSFKTKESVRLKRHIESKHEGIIHYRCKYMNCAYVANDIRSLRDHTGTHEAMFKCNFCMKYFARKRNLKRHINEVHDKIFSCQFPQCIFRSSKKEDISAHTDSKHAGEEPPNQCHLCNRTFSQKLTLKRHTRNVHGTAVDLKKREI